LPVLPLFLIFFEPFLSKSGKGVCHFYSSYLGRVKELAKAKQTSQADQPSQPENIRHFFLKIAFVYVFI